MLLCGVPRVQAGYGQVSLGGASESCEGPLGESASAVSGTSGGLTFDVGVPGVPGVPGEPFSLLLHYDSSLDDSTTYGTSIGVDVRIERHFSFGGSYGNDFVTVRGAEIQISDSGPPDTCGTNRIAWGTTDGGGGIFVPESCNTFTPQGDRPIESLHPTLLPRHDVLFGAGTGTCVFGTYPGNEPWLQFRLGFPVRLDGTNRNMRRPLGACPCVQNEIFSLAPGLHRVYAAITLEREDGSSHHYRCTEGFTTFLRGAGITAASLLGPNWSHSLADRLTEHVLGSETFVVLESYTGKWVSFAKPSTPIPPEGRELQQVPEGQLVKELVVTDPEYCWDCKAWRLIQIPTGYMQVNRDGSRRVFTTDGRLARIEDHQGRNATTIAWTVQSGVVVIDSVIDAGGNVHDFQYQTSPLRLERILLPGGRTWRLHYDGSGRLDRIDDPESFVTGLGSMHFGYDASGPPKRIGNIVTKTLPDGEVISYAYYCDPNDPADLPCSECGLCPPLDFARNTRPGALKSAQIGTDPARKYLYAYSNPTEGTSWMLAKPPGSDVGTATTPLQYFEYMPCGKGTREMQVPAGDASSAMGWDGLSRALAPRTVVTATRTDFLGRVRSVQRGIYDGLGDPWTDGEGLRGPKICFDYIGDLLGGSDDEDSAKLWRVRGPICRLTDPHGTFFECDDLLPNGDTCDPVEEMAWEEIVPAGGVLERERLKAVVPASQIASGPNPRPWGFMYWPESDLVAPGELRAVCDPTEWTTVPGVEDPFLVENCDGETTFEYELDASTTIVRPKRTIDGEGHATEFSYEPVTSLLTGVTDPLGHATTYAYDPATKLLASVTLPGGRKTSWTRNLRGQPTFTALPLDLPTEFSTQNVYSNGGRLASVRDLHRDTAWNLGHYAPGDASAGLPKYIERDPGAAGGSPVWLEFWSWTPAGQLDATMFDFDITRIVSLERDDFGFLTSRDMTGNSFTDECWSTDPLVGRPYAVVFQTPWNDHALECPDLLSWKVRYQFSYDDAGRTWSEQFRSETPGEDTRYTHTYAFDLDGHVVSSQAYSPNPRGYIGETKYTHDAAGRPLDTSVYRKDGDDLIEPGYLETLSFRQPDGSGAYDRDGRPLRRIEVERNRETTWTWRDDGRIQQQEVRDLNLLSPLLGQDTFSYDFTGTRLSRLEHLMPHPLFPPQGTKEVFEFTHDANDQLVYAYAHEDPLLGGPLIERYELEYVYDRSWNLVELHDLLSAGTTTLPVDGHDRLLGSEYAYDAGFNLIRNGLATELHDEFTFDVLNRLTQHRKVSGSGVTLATTDYAYDPFNRLIGVEDSSGRRWRAYSGWELAVNNETSDPDSDWRFFQGAGGGTIGHVLPGEDLEVYDRNAQGSRVQVGEQEYSPIYEPYGKFSGGASLDESPITFQGHEWRPESELYYMRNRWYHPELGRFLSVDPVRTSAVNNFAFAGNSPVLKGDALGLLPTWIEDRLNSAGYPRAQLAALRDILTQCSTGMRKRYLELTKDTPTGLRFDYGQGFDGAGWPGGAGAFYDPNTGAIFVDEGRFPPTGSSRPIVPLPTTAGTPPGLGVVQAFTSDSMGNRVSYGTYKVPANGSTAWDGPAEDLAHESYHALRGPGVADGQFIDQGTHALAYSFGIDVLRDLWGCSCP